MSNQDEQLQQVADYIETIRQAEAKRTPQELEALQRLANETLFPPPPIESSSIEAIKGFQVSYAGTQALLEEARVTRSLLDNSLGDSLRRIQELTDKAMAPAALAMRAMDSLIPKTGYEAMARLASSQIFQPLAGISELRLPSFESAATQAMERISGQIRALDGLKSFRTIWAENEAAQATLASFAQMHSFTEGLAKLHAAPKYSEMMKQVAILAESPLFEALERTSASKLAKLFEEYEIVEQTALVREPAARYGVKPVQEASLQTEIIDALEGKENRKPLTPAAFLLLCYILGFLSGTMALVSQWKDFKEGLCDLNDLTLQSESTAEANRLVRSSMCHMPKSAKARVRLVARDSVNLRYSPSMKAEVIMPLKQYAVLEVVDSSDKTWLEVIYKHEGIEIQGWVSRSMVKTIQ
ncbi:SH3 domain-containing protein [Pseudomonas sp. 25571]|uniref:SH3 domain-containing protein n=1 Tax=Pseudomonas sp. 25571 TaxID=2967216 RepID=UPI0023637C3F|nr:SH3 domain-containing protein [Pseudomonas sp. 25571]MDD2064485.1 SH3 domain-containing protein [Pseudomonas sp. 25571]